MKSVIAVWAALAALTLYPQLAAAQYMFLDSNGDSISSAADTLSLGTTTSVDIWLCTNQNRDGNSSSCATSGDQLTINSYSFCLRALGGPVTWGSYSNGISDFDLSFGQASSDSEYYVGFGSSTALPPGKYRLGSFSVVAGSGANRIEISPRSGLAGIYITCFGSQCLGSDGDNTLKLETDWVDADGLWVRDLPEGGPGSPEQPENPALPPQCPVIDSPAEVFGFSGFGLGFHVYVTEPNGGSIDDLTMDAAQLPPINNAVFPVTFHSHGQFGGTDAEGDFSWTPALSDTGTFRVILRATTTVACTRSDTVIVHVAPGPLLRVRMPGPDYHVYVLVWDEQYGNWDQFCVAGSDFMAVVPLGRITSANEVSWYDEVYVSPLYRNYAGYIYDSQGTQMLGLQLNPAANPADRITSYTPEYDPTWAFILREIRDVKRVYSDQYEYTPSSVPVTFKSGISETGPDGIALDHTIVPEDLYSKFTIAHEYSHWLQGSVVGWQVGCDTADTHTPCLTTFCPAGVWQEGFADGMADLYLKVAYGTTFVFSGAYGECPPGINEGNVAKYIYGMSRARPDAVMHTYRNGRFACSGPYTQQIGTFSEFRAIWRDIDPADCGIVVHAPGPFDDTGMYQRFIEHADVTTDVPIAPGAAVSRVRISSPNPARDYVDIETSVDPTGVSAMLFDVRGRVVLRKQIGSTGVTRLSTSGLAAGVYLLRVKGPSVQETRRVVLLH